MKTLTRLAALAAVLALLTPTLRAQVPQLVNYQGRVAVGTPAVNFEGTGQFRFALVDAAGTTTFWSNDNTSVGGSEPSAAVPLTVTKGLYSVLLGDTSLGASMTAIPASAWANADVRLRVWFNDGTNGSQLLTPDQRLVPNGYLADGSVSEAAIASGAITSTKIAAGAVTNTQLAAGAVQGANLAAGAAVRSLNGGGGITVDAATGAITLGSTATSANTASAIVARDASGDFSARTITLGGNLGLPATSATAGVITVGGVRLLHSFGVQNVFVGGSAGNFTMSGSGNTAIGFEALISNTSGASNVAVGRQALRLNTAGGNTALGTETLYTNTSGDNNTASGYRALHFNTTGGFNTAHGSSALVANTTGSENTAMGHSAMGSNTTGTANTAMGLNALFGNTTGTANTASGYKALRVNSTGYFNTASGTRALEANSTGFENTASGVSALTGNTTGNNNVAFGKSALERNTTGNFNTASGSLSLFKNTTGTSNTATGINALYENTTGSSNIAIGSGAGSLLTTGSNNIAIGHTGFAGEGNIIRIGTAQTDTFLAGIIHGNGAGLTSLPAGSITGTIGAPQIAAGAVGNSQLASGLTLGGMTAGTFSGPLTGNVTGNVNLPVTSSSSAGVISQNGSSLVHSFGSGNFFAGLAAGNFTMSGDYNTAVGAGAFLTNGTGSQNTAIGNAALNSNTEGYRNTASGFYALLSNSTGFENTAVGAEALGHNTIGEKNTAIGINALYLNTTGYRNTASGANALYSNSTGITNTAIGFEALRDNTTGSNNVAVGTYALHENIDGGANVAVGFATLAHHPSGIWNTAIGDFALNGLMSGRNNTALGISAGIGLTTGSENIYIAHLGVAVESDTTRLGQFQTRAFIAGIRGVTTGQADAVPVVIDSAGQLGTVSSSRRYKEDIADMGDASARLQALRPVTFRYKKPYANGEKPVQFGLIAEEVAETFPELAVFNAEGQPETVKYQDLTPLLLNEVQKLCAEKDALAKQLAERDVRDKERDARIARLESLLPVANQKEVKP